ncbi:MAG: acyltransferase [Methylacidiphilales bacterium]|nr:acyltransferase [Candidatus Methylacidiphilales bacterium]
MPKVPPTKTDGTAAEATAKVENIQALRGIAALLVVWGHLKFPMADLCPGAESNPLVQTAHGAIGVDLFFIISGYVICLTACKRHGRALDFFLARVARVSPLYLAAFLPALLWKDHASGAHLSLHSIWNGIFYLPIFDWEDYTEPPVGVGWTLSFEMWFYVAFALLLLIWRPAKVALFLPVLFFIGAPLMIFYHGAWYFPRFLFHPFVLEFAMGCVIFHLQKRMVGWIPWLLLAGGIFCALAFTRHTGYLGWHEVLLSSRMDLAWLRVLLWGVPSAFIVAGLVGLERNHDYVLPRLLVWLGGISYSLYLTHRFSMAIAAKAGAWIGLHNPVMVALTVLLFSVLVAWLCWTWVEQPLTSRAQGWAKQMTRPMKRVEKDSIRLEPVADVL